MSRQSAGLATLAAGVLLLALAAPACTTAQAEPLDVTYYFLPG